jgi:HSP20 family protein
MFRGFFVRPMTLESRGWTGGVPFRVDISENDREYRILAEMPGVRKEDINVTINKGEIVISAELKKEQEAGSDARMLWAERQYGRLQRSFVIEHEVDEAGAQAKYLDGVLELVLPKSAQVSGKRLTVH